MAAAPIILVADSKEEVLNCLKEELPALSCALLHARDGQEALSVLEDQASHIAIAVVELELPIVNGFDLIGRLRSKDPKPRRIIATTSLEHDLVFELAKHMGADLIVRKPIPKETLIETVRPLFHDVRIDGQPGT